MGISQYMRKSLSHGQRQGSSASVIQSFCTYGAPLASCETISVRGTTVHGSFFSNSLGISGKKEAWSTSWGSWVFVRTDLSPFDRMDLFPLERTDLGYVMVDVSSPAPKVEFAGDSIVSMMAGGGLEATFINMIKQSGIVKLQTTTAKHYWESQNLSLHNFRETEDCVLHS